MQVELAKSAGFCFGVQRAVDTVYKQIEENSAEKIYTYGPIIHNEEVIKDMEKKGVEVILSEEELKQIKSGIVIIRSHGVPKRICDLLDENGVRYPFSRSGKIYLREAGEKEDPDRGCNLSICEENT